MFITDHRTGRNAGYELRVANTVAALSEVTDLSIVYLSRNDDERRWPGNEEAKTFIADQARWKEAYIKGLLTRRPRDVIFSNEPDLVQKLEPLLTERLDLLWFFRARPYEVARPILSAMTHRPRIVIDFDDLYDDFYRQTDMLAHLPTLRRRVLKATYKLDSRMWAQHQQRLVKTADLSLVTNRSDAERLAATDAPGVRVLPNGYPMSAPAGTKDGKCRILFVGGHHYRPNGAAVHDLAHQVLPNVRRSIPDAELLLVGRRGPVTSQIEGLHGVRYLGRVEDLDPVFNQASVVATPVKFGAGSRLKVLEALARQVPLVSDKFACSGFDLVDGRHYLRADHPAKMAAAILALHDDPERARQLVAEGHAYFSQNYSSTIVRQRTVELAEEALAHPSAGATYKSR